MQTASANLPEAILALLADRPDLSPGEVADATGTGRSTAAKRLAALEQAGKIRRRPGGRDGRRKLPDRWSIPEACPAKAVRPTPGDDHQRLGRGQLDKLVLVEMAAHPEEPLGPAGIAKGIRRSSGAVANGLDRLAGSGQVILVATSPRRYQLTNPGVVTPLRSNAGVAKAT
jgi:DNA-binding transcriptional ArsR family regulator